MEIIITKPFYSGALKSYNFVWNINWFNPPTLQPLQRVSCFILGKELFLRKAFCIFLSSLTICFGTAVINAWRTIFDIAIVLKITFFPSSLSFLIFHIFKTCYISLTIL